MRDSYIFYASFYEAIKELGADDRLIVYDAINEYSLTGVMSELTGIPKAMMSLIKPQIDANQRRFENGQKGKEYGKLGGRPKKITPNGDIDPVDETPNITPNITPNKPQENPKQTPNVNVNVNVNENVNNIHTHLFFNLNFSLRVRAENFLAWVAAEYPAVQQMAEPLTEQHAQWIVSKYAAQDVERIVMAIDNKGATKNKSAYATFCAYADSDKIIKERRQTKDKLYTYADVCNLIDKKTGSFDDFTKQEVGGIIYYKKKDFLTTDR